MNCPTCDGPTYVLDTRIYGDVKSRRRQCNSRPCGTRFSTQEHIIEESIALHNNRPVKHYPKMILVPDAQIDD